MFAEITNQKTRKLKPAGQDHYQNSNGAKPVSTNKARFCANSDNYTQYPWYRMEINHRAVFLFFIPLQKHRKLKPVWPENFRRKKCVKVAEIKAALIRVCFDRNQHRLLPVLSLPPLLL